MPIIRCVLSVMAMYGVIFSAHACTPKARVEYRTALVDDDLPIHHNAECVEEARDAHSYKYPDGRESMVLAAFEPLFSIELDKSVTVRIVRYLGDGESRPEFAEVRLSSAGRHFSRARDVLSKGRVQGCDLLITVDGVAVGFAWKGTTDWSRTFPGGQFASVEDARRVYKRTGAVLVDEIATPEEMDELRRYMEYAREVETWQFYCDLHMKESLKASDPDRYMELNARNAPDCKIFPEYPDEE